jgi:hypothetical protein
LRSKVCAAESQSRREVRCRRETKLANSLAETRIILPRGPPLALPAKRGNSNLEAFLEEDLFCCGFIVSRQLPGSVVGGSRQSLEILFHGRPSFFTFFQIKQSGIAFFVRTCAGSRIQAC